MASLGACCVLSSFRLQALAYPAESALRHHVRGKEAPNRDLARGPAAVRRPRLSKTLRPGPLSHPVQVELAWR